MHFSEQLEAGAGGEERGNHGVCSSSLPRWLVTWAPGVFGLMVIGRKLMTIAGGLCYERGQMRRRFTCISWRVLNSVGCYSQDQHRLHREGQD